MILDREYCRNVFLAAFTTEMVSKHVYAEGAGVRQMRIEIDFSRASSIAATAMTRMMRIARERMKEAWGDASMTQVQQGEARGDLGERDNGYSWCTQGFPRPGSWGTRVGLQRTREKFCRRRVFYSSLRCQGGGTECLLMTGLADG